MIVETLEGLASQLQCGKTTSRDLTETCLARIEDEAGEGALAFLSTDAEGAIATADFMDSLLSRFSYRTRAFSWSASSSLCSNGR